MTERALDDVIARARNPGPVMDGPVAETLRRVLGDQFASGGARFGAPWAPRSPRDTVERLFAMMGAPLVRTGALERSLTVRGAEYGFAEVRDGGMTLEISTVAPGAVEAQLGTAREPARPIMPDDVPDDVAEAIADRIGDYILEGLLSS